MRIKIGISIKICTSGKLGKMMNRLKIYCIKFLKNKLEKEEKINNYTFVLKNTKITNIC